MLWVTREGGNIDRVACPWLIKRFIDPKAQFVFVPRDQVLEVAKRLAPSRSTPRGPTTPTGRPPRARYVPSSP